MARNSKRSDEGTTVVDLDVEDSVGSQGTYGKVVPVAAQMRESRPRKAPEEHPACPHCGGKMHWNAAGAAINMECLWRQFCLATGRMDSPYDRLPVFEEADMEPWTEWKNTRKKSRKNPLTYGKMASASGGAATYSALRAATKSAETVAAEVKPAKNGKTKVKQADLVDPLAAKKRGRPAKAAVVEAPVVEAPAKRRGRPPKQAVVEAPVVEAPAKRRGRPPKQAPVMDVSAATSFDFDDEEVTVKPKKSAKNKAGKNKTRKSK